MENTGEYKVMGSIWIEGKNGPYAGSGRVQLLEKIRELGSISGAARAIRMSYRQAWELINSMNKQSDKPVVEKVVGGAGGGGTRITDTGVKVIEQYRRLHSDFMRFMEEHSKDLSL